jgi:4-amino-4-deoxy-L-arabinose transferase-like glycosyltransferase
MQRQTKSFTKIAVLILLALAFLLRVYKIGSNPPSLDWDEVSHGYNAYSILRTGKDEWGKTFPLIFRAYGDYKLPVYIYLTAISEYIFGLSNFSVRIVSILAGTLSVLFTYLLVQELFWKDKYKNKYALLSAVLMAIEPWSFFLSRAAFEANLALFFSISGFYFFLKGMRKNDWKILLGSVFLGLTVWTYNSYRIFTPLLVIVAILIYRYEFVASMKKNKFLVFSYALILLIFFIPMLAQLLGTTGQARYSWVAILDAGGIGKIIELRNSSGFNPTITRLLYNRPTYFLYNFVKNYFSHFSPNFLFLKGGSFFAFWIRKYFKAFQQNQQINFVLGYSGPGCLKPNKRSTACTEIHYNTTYSYGFDICGVVENKLQIYK